MLPRSPRRSPAPTLSPARNSAIAPPARPAEAAPPHTGADAIVVLGCRLEERGGPSPALRRRVALGVALYREGAAPLLILSGGGRGPVAEAEAMRELALAAGAPPTALLTEPRSRDTLENALFTARLLAARRLGERGKARVVLVSDRLHLPRAALLFRLAGLSVAGRAGVRPPAGGAPLRILYEIGSLPLSLGRALVRRGR